MNQSRLFGVCNDRRPAIKLEADGRPSESREGGAVPAVGWTVYSHGPVVRTAYASRNQQKLHYDHGYCTMINDAR